MSTIIINAVDGINEDGSKSRKINNKRGGWDFLENLEELLTEIFSKVGKIRENIRQNLSFIRIQEYSVQNKLKFITK